MSAESIEKSSLAVPSCIRTGFDRHYNISYHTDSEAVP